ncbi:MAG: DUF554 domain-containing protein [Peptococcaceae bacterium]|nr:DUF554 domain-containing protein [Peptococcaceae bacterium]NLM20885.1 DUF554 domain-containing protein [Peptococcaceae bacterium]
MFGTQVNVIAIVAGGLIGTIFGKIIPERIRNTILQGLALVVILIGLEMALETGNILIVIASLVLGAIVGELIDIECRLNQFGKYLETKLSRRGRGNFTKAFVTASLVYCVGAMAIVGALQDGLNGDHSILFAKSALDGVTSIIFSASMGIGVIFAALPVLIYQGSIALFAGILQGILSDAVIVEMTAVGGLLIFGIGINILQIKDVKVANLLPSIFFAIPLVILFNYLGIY